MDSKRRDELLEKIGSLRRAASPTMGCLMLITDVLEALVQEVADVGYQFDPPSDDSRTLTEAEMAEWLAIVSKPTIPMATIYKIPEMIARLVAEVRRLRNRPSVQQMVRDYSADTHP